MMTDTRGMARMILIGLASAAAAIMLLKAQEKAANGPNGRYQIVAGSYMMVSGTTSGISSVQESAVFKIDTATGQAWQFTTGQIGKEAKGFYIYWHSIDQEFTLGGKPLSVPSR